MDESKEHFDVDENNQSLKIDLETCKSENKSLKTRISEVTRERDEALSRLRNSERLVYLFSVIICIVAVGFAVAVSTRKSKCNDNPISTKEEVKTLQKPTEHCMADLSNCNSIIHDIKEEIKTNQAKIQQCNDMLMSSQTLLKQCKGKKCTKDNESDQINDKLEQCNDMLMNSQTLLKQCKGKKCTKDNESDQINDKLEQCNDMLMSSQTLLKQCKGKTCIKDNEYDQINDKLKKCTFDLNNFTSKNPKSKNIDKQQNKNDRKLKKCQSCLQDMESLNNLGVHKVKDQVLQVIQVERPWRTARKDCWERGGDLVVPRNVDKLAEYLLEKEPDITNFWVGISDLVKAEEFLGVNGGRVVGGWEQQNEIYRAGNPSEKNPGNDCVRLTYTDPYSKGLVSTNCEAMMYYICDMATNTQHDIYN